MKILHVSIGLPPFRVGGLTRYCYDLMRQQQAMGHDVQLLYPSNYSIMHKTFIKTKKEHNFTVHKIINPLPLALVFGINSPERYMKKCNSNCYENFFKKNKPEVIHVHSIMGIHKEFFDAAHSNNIPIIFTTHDYYPFCLKCTFLDNNNELCENNNAKKCMECNSSKGLSPLMEILMQSNLYRYFKYSKPVTLLRNNNRNKITQNSNEQMIKRHKIQNEGAMYRKLLNYYKGIMKNIDIIHANSNLSKEIYSKYLPNLWYEVIPITHSRLPAGEVSAKERINGVFRVGFLGGSRKEKGLDILVEALELIHSEDVKFELVLWGADYSPEFNSKINTINNGCYKQSELFKVFSTFDLLVVPSVWWETFGYIVLEALSFSTPVICSDCVGASMLLKDMPVRLIYNSRNIKELSDLILRLSDEKTFSEMIEYINNMELDNSMEKHTKKILGIYSKACN